MLVCAIGSADSRSTTAVFSWIQSHTGVDFVEVHECVLARGEV